MRVAPRSLEHRDSTRSRLLAVARALGQPFGPTALVLAAWRAYPHLFGLPGCEAHHPDTRRVLACLSGPRGLVAAGLIRRRAGGLLEVQSID